MMLPVARAQVWWPVDVTLPATHDCGSRLRASCYCGCHTSPLVGVVGEEAGRGSERFCVVRSIWSDRSEWHKHGICRSLELVGSGSSDDPNAGMGSGDRTNLCCSTS